MTRFRMDNTEGYSAEELAELNAAFENIAGDIEYKSWLDRVAEELQFRYDQGKRGADLLAIW